MIIDRAITIRLVPREDGGLNIWSDDILGLILSSSDQVKVLLAMGEAIIALQTHDRNRNADCRTDQPGAVAPAKLPR